MMQSKRNRNIVVVSHKVVHQPDDDLVLYLNNNSYDNVLHITHSFANAKDRKSNYCWYKKGTIYKRRETYDYKAFPEPILYLKEFYFTILWVLQTKIVWDCYIGFDGLCVLFGNVLKKFSRIEKTIFWAIDFVPKARFKSGIKNSVYNWINKNGYLKSDEMWDLSPRMLQGRKEHFGIEKTDYKKHRLVQYGLWSARINPVAYKNCDKETLLFMGNLSQYQGLQLIIATLPQLIKKYPRIRLRIIGDGEYTKTVKELAKKLGVNNACDFMGRIQDANRMEKEIVRAAIGVAPYVHALDSISKYADPGKIKTYLACGVPVLTTDVPWNAKEIEMYKCGLIIKESEKDIIDKISYLLNGKNNELYRNNALKYAHKFNYEEIFSRALS